MPTLKRKHSVHIFNCCWWEDKSMVINKSLRPPAIGSIGCQSFGTNFSMQFRPVAQQGQPFMQSASGTQQYRPVGQGMPTGQPQLPQFSQPMQQMPARPSQPGHLSPSSQAMPMPYMQPNMTFPSSSPQFQNSATTNSHMPSLGGPGVPLSSSYTIQLCSLWEVVVPRKKGRIFCFGTSHNPMFTMTGMPSTLSNGQSYHFAPTPEVTQLQEALQAEQEKREELERRSKELEQRSAEEIQSLQQRQATAENIVNQLLAQLRPNSDGPPPP